MARVKTESGRALWRTRIFAADRELTADGVRLNIWSMEIVILGSGMQGTLFGVKLARAGHGVTLIARGARAAELRRAGARIENLDSRERIDIALPVLDAIPTAMDAEVCLVTLRQDQAADALPMLAASKIKRIVFMFNQAAGAGKLRATISPERAVLAFPGFAGGLHEGVDQYVEIPQQPTVVESQAKDILHLFRSAGLRCRPVADMDSWLRRHAVFVTAISGALCESGIDPQELARHGDRLRGVILATREGWKALDWAGVRPAPFMLRTIIEFVPLPLAVLYWRRLLASSRGELYFARHLRNATREMQSLARDIATQLNPAMCPHLSRLYAALADCEMSHGV